MMHTLLDALTRRVLETHGGGKYGVLLKLCNRRNIAGLKKIKFSCFLCLWVSEMPCTGSVNYSHRRFYHRTPKCGRCQVWSGYYNKCMDVKKERYGHHVQNELYPVFFVTFTNYSQDIHLNRNVVGAYSHKCGQCGVWSYRFCKCVRRTFCDLKPKPKPEPWPRLPFKRF